MQPTMKLRWVYKTRIIEKYPSGVKSGQKYKVLQQWWEEQRNEITPPPGIQPIFRSPPRGEWRDIPIEVEE